MKIKAARLQEPKRIEIEEMELEDLKENEVSIRPEFVGICGSDAHFFEEGKIGNCVVSYPFILGHECAGTVVGIGKNVKKFKVGDRVTVEPQIPCGTCVYCRSGRYNLCPEVKFLSTPPYDGVLREEFHYREDMTYLLPQEVSSLEGALIEPLAVGLYAVKRGKVTPGMRAAILGGGCIGLMTLLACKAAGASVIMVSDLFENRLKKALNLGATDVFCSGGNADIMSVRDALTGGEGFDVVFETAGNKVTAAQTSGLLKRGGTIVMVGNIVPEVSFSFRNLYLKEGEIRAVFRYRNIFPEAIEQIASGRIVVKDVVSDIVPFEHTQEAFEKAMTEKADVIKTVVSIGI